ncbi:MAG: hypothetical protein ACP5E3_12485 [Bacteroidales bacterium]
MYNDSQLDIDWKIEENKQIISEKDQNLPGFDPSVHLF